MWEMVVSYTKTSSEGNCSVITNEAGDMLIVDCGIKFDKINKAIGYQLHNANGILLTHAHSDHIAFYGEFAKLGITTLLNPETRSKVASRGSQSNLRVIDYSAQYNIGEFIIKPFPLIHTSMITDGDAEHKVEVPCECTGYLIFDKCSKEKMLWITDTAYVENRFPPVEHICIECNYFEKEDYAEELPYLQSLAVEKRRLFSHLSFEECIRFINSQDNSKLKTIRLLHMSTSLTNGEKSSIITLARQKINNLKEDVIINA